jgi:hypothetical protein
VFGFVGFHRTATRETEGIASLSISSRLPLSSAEIKLIPVMFPPGRARLATSPAPTGSAMAAITIGIVRVAFWTAIAVGVVPATMMSTLRRTRSATREM